MYLDACENYTNMQSYISLFTQWSVSFRWGVSSRAKWRQMLFSYDDHHGGYLAISPHHVPVKELAAILLLILTTSRWRVRWPSCSWSNPSIDEGVGGHIDSSPDHVYHAFSECPATSPYRVAMKVLAAILLLVLATWKCSIRRPSYSWPWHAVKDMAPILFLVLAA